MGTRRNEVRRDECAEYSRIAELTAVQLRHEYNDTPWMCRLGKMQMSRSRQEAYADAEIHHVVEDEVQMQPADRVASLSAVVRTAPNLQTGVMTTAV